MPAAECHLWMAAWKLELEKMLPSLTILRITALLGWIAWFSVQLLQAQPWPQMRIWLKLLDILAIVLYNIQLFLVKS